MDSPPADPAIHQPGHNQRQTGPRAPVYCSKQHMSRNLHQQEHHHTAKTVHRESLFQQKIKQHGKYRCGKQIHNGADISKGRGDIHIMVVWIDHSCKSKPCQHAEPKVSFFQKFHNKPPYTNRITTVLPCPCICQKFKQSLILLRGKTYISRKKLLDRRVLPCYNTPRGDEKHPLIYGPLAQLVRASGS